MTLQILRELKSFRKIEPSTTSKEREGKSMFGRVLSGATKTIRNGIIINPAKAPPFVFYVMIRLVKKQVLKNSNLGQFLKYWQTALC